MQFHLAFSKSKMKILFLFTSFRQVSLGRAIISDDDGPAGKYLSNGGLAFQKNFPVSDVTEVDLARKFKFFNFSKFLF